jgi:RNA methyltransferase, TrmH family
MIAVAKLAKLAPRHRMRKAALVLAELERGLLAHPDRGEGSVVGYLSALAELLLAERQSPEPVLAASARLSKASQTAGAASGGVAPTDEAGSELVRAIDQLRHALLAASGQAPADWDLIDPRTGAVDVGSRRVFPSIKAYLEDLRSPFNVGSVFRTADA